MEDVFYFTKANVTLADIAKIAEHAGYQIKAPDISKVKGLNVYYNGDFWSWTPVQDLDRQSWDPADLSIVDAFQPNSSYVVSYHPLSWPLLRDFLKLMLQRYDGWVGSDRTRWLPIYTLENIDTEPNEIYVKTLDYRNRIRLNRDDQNTSNF